MRAQRQPLEVRDRLAEEIRQHPIRRFRDYAKRIAAKAGLSASYIQNVMSLYCPVTDQSVDKIATALKLDRGYILTGVRTPPPPPESSAGGSEAIEQGLPEEPSVRDWFAMSAMNAMMAQGLPPADTAKEYAVTAYICADAMMEARQA